MSLLKHAKNYAVNHTKYAHLNAFVSLVSPTELAVRSGSPPRTTYGNDEVPSDVAGKPIAIKDNICTTKLKTTAASGILRDFTSPYNATVVKLLEDAGAVVVGKTNMDEFGMGSHSLHTPFGAVKMENANGEETSAGGSSGGSAVAVATSQCWTALGTDTGGSVRLPAAYTGVVGFKPSYGLLSRWGVIAYANSLDTVGIFGRRVEDVKSVFEKLNVADKQDPTSLLPSTRTRLEQTSTKTPCMRIGIPMDYNITTLHPKVRKAWIDTLRKLWENGHTLHPVRLPATQHALSAYYILAPAEASSNLAKYDGVRFGSRAEGVDGTTESVLFAKTRSQGLGPEVQRRILLGAFSLSAYAMDNYFIQAQKIRRLVQKDFNHVFAKSNPLLSAEKLEAVSQDQVDVLLCPTAPSAAPSIAKAKEQTSIEAYMNDVFTVPASLAGLPAISVPIASEVGKEGLGGSDNSPKTPIGIQVIGQIGDDELVLDYARKIEDLAPYPQPGTGPDVLD